jgi:VCBS repeat-containing protein
MTRRRTFLFLGLFLAAVAGEASDLRILADLDRNAQTGCAEGGFSGAEQVWIISLEMSGAEPKVISVVRQICVAGSFFAAPEPIQALWAAGRHPTDATWVIEGSLGFEQLGITLGSGVRFGVGSEVADLQPAQGGRRRAVRSTPQPPPPYVADGGIAEWSGAIPLFRSDGITVYAVRTLSGLAIRIDVTDGPQANNDVYVVPRRGTIDVAAPGVLANDLIFVEDPITIAVTSSVASGALTMHEDGGFTYSHDGTDVPLDHFEYSIHTAGGRSDSATVLFTIAGGASAAPPAAADDTFTMAEGGTLTSDPSGLLGNDSDSDTPREAWTITVVAPPAHGVLQLQTDGSFTFQHDGSETTSDSFIYEISDGTAAASATARISITGINDPPVITLPASQTTAEDTPLPVDAIVVADADAGAADIRVTLTVANGTATLTSVAALSGSGTGNIVATGTLAAINAALAGLTFQPASHVNGPASIRIVADDLGHSPGPAATDDDTLVINVTAVNDRPALSMTGAATFNEDGPAVPLAGTAVASDADGTMLQSASVRITGNFAAGQDELLFSDTAAISGTFAGDALLLTGAATASEYATALQSITYRNLSQAPSTLPRTITWTVSDGTADSNAQTTALTVIAVNDPPSIEPASFAFAENTTTVGTVTASDVDDTLRFSISAGNAGEIFAIDPGSGALRVAAGKIANFEATPAYTLTVQVTENGPAALTAAATVDIDLTNVNEPPVLTMPGAQTMDAATTLTFSTASGRGIGVQDPDATEMEVMLAVHLVGNVPIGALNLAGTSGLTFQQGDGMEDATMRFRGSPAAIRIALDGMIWTPAPTFAGRFGIDITANDLGTSGAGVPLTDSETIRGVIVAPETALNDAPQIVDADGVRWSSYVGEARFDSRSGPVVFRPALHVFDSDAGTATMTAFASVNGPSGAQVRFGPGGTPLPFPPPFAGITGRIEEIDQAVHGLQFEASAPGEYALGLTISDEGASGPCSPALSTPCPKFTNYQFRILVEDPSINDPPVHTPFGPFVVNEGTPAVLPPLAQVGDPDVGSNPLRVTLEATFGSLTLLQTARLTFVSGDGAGDSVVTFTGTLSDVNAALQAVQFIPAPDYSGPASITIETSDQGATGPDGPKSDRDTLIVSIAPALPAIDAAPSASQPYVEGAPPFVLDPTVTITRANRGVLDASVAIQTGFVFGADRLELATTPPGITASSSGQVLTLTGTGTLADFQNALRAVTFRTDGISADATRTIRWQIRERETLAAAFDETTLQVREGNDAPVISSPSVGAATEDTPVSFSQANGIAFSIADPDAGSGAIRVTLSATNGSLVFPNPPPGMTPTLVTVPLDQLNVLLSEGLLFTPAPNFHGPATVTITVNDLGGSGPGGARESSRTLAFPVMPIPDAPELEVSGAVAHGEGGEATPIAITATIASVDTDPTILSASIEIRDNLSFGEDVLEFANTAAIAGAFDGRILTLTGTDTPANYAAALRSVTYRNTSDTPSTMQRTLLWFVVSAGGASAFKTTTVNVLATNDAPVNTLPAPPTIAEDTAVVLSATSMIRISDADAESDDVRVQLEASTGAVSVNSGAVPPLTSLSGDGTASVAITGSVAEINAALNGLRFTPAADFTGAATLRILTDDLGHNPGPALTDDDTLTIMVTSVNDVPAMAAQARAVAENSPNGTTVGAPVAFTDPDSGQTYMYAIVGGNTANAFAIDNSGQITVNDSGALDYEVRPSYALTVRVTDSELGAGQGVVTVDVINVNEAPSIQGPAETLTASEDVALALTGDDAIVITDDSGSGAIRVTLTTTSGTLTLGATTSGTVTMTDTLANVNAALAGVQYTSMLNASGPAQIAVNVDDQGSTGSGTAQTASAVFNVDVIPVNDAPVTTMPVAAQSLSEDSNIVLSAANSNAMSVADVDAASDQELIVTLQSTSGQAVFVDTGLAGFTGTLSAINTRFANGVRVTPAANFFGTATLTVSVNDQGSSPAPAQTGTRTLAIQVDPVNDAPELTTPVLITADEDSTFVAISGVSVSDDSAGNAIEFTASVATAGSGTLSMPGATTGATIHVSGITLAQLNTALASLRFHPAAEFSGAVQIDLTFNDLAQTGGGTPLTDSASIAVNITSVNDRPAFTLGPDPATALTTGASQVTVPNFATNRSAGPSNESGQSLVSFNVSVSPAAAALFAVQPAINVNTGTLTYTPAEGVSGTVVVSVTLTDNGPAPNTSDPQTFTLTLEGPPYVASTVPAVGARGAVSAPITIAFNEPVTLSASAFTIQCGASTRPFTLNATTGTTFVLTPSSPLINGHCDVSVDGDLVSDTDTIDPPGYDVAADFAIGFDLNSPPQATDDAYADFGNITLVVANPGVIANDTSSDAEQTMTIASTGPITGSGGGTFTFQSGGGFTYVPPIGFSGADSVTYTVSDGVESDTAQLTVNVGTTKYWYVQHDAAPFGNGRMSSPFQTLGAAISAASAGDTILILAGGAGEVNPFGPTFLSKSNLTIRGQSATAFAPALNGQPYTLLAAGSQATLTSASDSTLQVSATGNTISNLHIRSTGSGHALSAHVPGGTLTLDDVSITSSGGGGGISLSETTLSGNISNLTVSNSLTGIELSNAAGSLTIDGGSITTATGGDVFSAVFLFGGTVSLTYRGGITQGGDLPMVSILDHQSGTVTFDNGILSAEGQDTGIRLFNADGVYNFNGTTTVHGGSVGVEVTGGSSGTISFGASASVTNCTSSLFSISGSAPTFTYSGSFSGTSVDTGVSIAFNTGGTIRFNGSGAGITKSIGGTTAISTFENSASTAIEFTGGGLALSARVSASGEGSLIIAGTENTMNATVVDNEILEVAHGMTIGAAGLNFRSISGSGFGVSLNNTGTAGSFTVTGEGTTAGSGGTLIGGISISGAGNVHLQNMNITGGAFVTLDSGRRVDITNNTLSGNLWAASVSGTGTVNISDNTIAGVGISVAGVSGGANATISGNNLTGGGASTGIQVSGAFPITAHVVGNTITGYTTDSAIRIDSFLGGSINATVENNTISNSSRGLLARARQGSVCLNLVNNTIDGSNSTRYFLIQSSGIPFQLQGLTGSGTDAANVAAFVAGTDTTGSPFNIDIDPGYVNYTAGTCSTVLP